MSYWSNKTVWVTGASSGIGEAISIEMAQSGAKLILSSRNREKLEVFKNSLPNSQNHVVLPIDVSNATAVQEVVSANKALLETVDILVNNAGISQRAYTWEASHESERHIMETNYFGPIVLAKAVLPGMMKRNFGHIINMSSVVGKIGFPLRSSYAASKHALHGYFDTLRAELVGKNIHVMVVCPGRIKTNISLNAVTGDGTKHGEMDPGQAGGIPADVCAHKILSAAQRHKAELYIGKEQFLIYLDRYFPRLFRAIVSKFNPK